MFTQTNRLSVVGLAAAAKMHFNEHYVGDEVFGSGEGGEEFLYAQPANTWAQIGADPVLAPAKMMDEVYGKRAAEANYTMVMNSVEAHWSDAWQYDKELSFIPSN